MAYQLYAILLGLKIITGNWKSHIQSIRAIQELYSTAGMGMFIGLNAQTQRPKERLMHELNIALKVHLFLTPACFVYNLYWTEIAQTPWLAAWFSQFPSWRAFLSKRLKKQGWWEWTFIGDDLIVLLTSLFTRYCTFKSTLELIENPWLFSVAIREQFFIEDKLRNESHVLALQHILQKTQDEQESIEPPLISNNLIRFFHPAIDLEWSVMKASILQLYVYDYLSTTHPETLRAYRKPATFVKGQRFRFYENEQELAWSEILDSGRIECRVKTEIEQAMIATDEEIQTLKKTYGPENVRVYQLDTHGIKSPKIAAIRPPTEMLASGLVASELAITARLFSSLTLVPGIWVIGRVNANLNGATVTGRAFSYPTRPGQIPCSGNIFIARTSL